jgi:site-specific DNA-methyltransferase (adenine-specific)
MSLHSRRLDMIRLYNQDCLEAIREIESNSIDLVLTDPPYNIKKDTWDKWSTQEEYVSWCGQWIKQVERVLKDNGSFYWFHNDMMQIIKIMDWIEKNTNFVFKQFITWNKYFENMKSLGFAKRRLSISQSRNYYNGFTEYILFYTFQDESGLKKVKHDISNFQSLRSYFKEYQAALGLKIKDINRTLGHRKAEHCFYWGSTQWDLPTKETYKELSTIPLKSEFIRKEYEELRKEYEELRKEYEEQRYTFEAQLVDTKNFHDQKWNNNVWCYDFAPKEKHLTPKPIPLLENILLHSSKENDTVLDIFMGSGSTGIACKNLKRNFIGIEKNTDYFEHSKVRIHKHRENIYFNDHNDRQLSLFGA